MYQQGQSIWTYNTPLPKQTNKQTKQQKTNQKTTTRRRQTDLCLHLSLYEVKVTEVVLFMVSVFPFNFVCDKRQRSSKKMFIKCLWFAV